MKKFIKVQDEEVAKRLSSLGFQLISQDSNVFTFLNNFTEQFAFSEFEKKKIIYTDILNV